jgi:hypothetical protein
VVNLPIDAGEYAEMLSGLIAKSRYQKKTSVHSDDVDMSQSFGTARS